ncbi:uncharacterized protein LOC144584477 isoform X1 [Pogona vitticeps]
MVERAWLCGLVVLLWAEGDACLESRGPTDREWLNPTDSLGNHQHSPIPYQWAAVLTCAMLVASLCLSTVVCCCTFRWSRSHPPLAGSPYVQWIQLEESEPSAQAPSSPEPFPSPAAEGPRGDTDQPPPSPIVQVHRTQAETSDDEATPGPLVHRNVPRRAGPPGLETEQSAEQ